MNFTDNMNFFPGMIEVHYSEIGRLRERSKAMQKIQQWIAEMTLEEKISLCSGRDFWHTQEIERLGIPSVMIADGPHGLRKETGDHSQPGLAESVPATCFPTASALAASWNRDLVFRVGAALGEECRQEKVGVLLGPGANIKRSPLCGRNFEYFSEDPYLSGEMAVSHIQGVQSRGIGTSLKHYAANNQEHRRMTIDAVIDSRALQEIYLRGFEIAVKKAQPWTVMGAYNRINGTYCCEHPGLLGEILREKWGYHGLVVSDWGAVNDPAASLQAGLDLEMPGVDGGNRDLLLEAVRTGRLNEAVLDRAAAGVLKMVVRAQETLAEDFDYDPDAHHTLAREAAGEGAVLLKNEQSALPLAKGARTAVLGAMAASPRYQGAGSSIINPTRLDTLHGEMVRMVGEAQIVYAPGYPLDGEEEEKLLQEAVQAARSAEAVVVHVGLPDLYEVEGLDREHLRLPESHNRLIEAAADVHERVIVVLSCGAPVEMPWIDRVQAVLLGYLGGQAGGAALADLLYGGVNPSGKLAETFPMRLEDTPAYHHFPGGPRTVEYRESLYVGYRFYDSVGKDVLFPFGHGLSYTSFAYRGLSLSEPRIRSDQPLMVSLQVQNSGPRAGQEVVQLYVAPQTPTAFRPRMELKGFEKVRLEPGEKKTVTFQLGARAFAYYNSESGDWQVESGPFEILVGASSHDLRLRGKVLVESAAGDQQVPEQDRLPAYKDFPADGGISTEDFQALLQRPLPDPQPPAQGEYTLNTPIADMTDSFFGRLLRKLMERQLQRMMEGEDHPNAAMMEAVLEEAPLRTLVTPGGALSRGAAEGLLLLINGHFFRGLLHLIKNR